jgi:hypothetical protein
MTEHFHPSSQVPEKRWSVENEIGAEEYERLRVHARELGAVGPFPDSVDPGPVNILPEEYFTLIWPNADPERTIREHFRGRTNKSIHEEMRDLEIAIIAIYGEKDYYGKQEADY